MRVLPVINLPAPVIQALENGSPLVLSVSGGKDSEAMTRAVLAARAAAGWSGSVTLIHADLGRMEWEATPAYMQRMAARYGYDLVTVDRDHDLLEGIQRRADKLAGQNKPAFPSSAARYCTAGWKRNVINSWIRHQFPADTTVIQCIGLRRDESRARSKTPDYAYNDMPSAPTLNRHVLNWYPIADWSTDDVWNSLDVTPERLAEVQAAVEAGTTPDATGWLYHPAYAYGNSRLSCALCVLADPHDIANGAKHNPSIYRALVDIELSTGFAFQQGKPLYAVAPDLLTDGQRARLPAPNG